MTFVLMVLAWVPLLVSATLLGASWMASWTVGAGSVRTLTLVLQSILAVTLIVRTKLELS